MKIDRLVPVFQYSTLFIVSVIFKPGHLPWVFLQTISTVLCFFFPFFFKYSSNPLDAGWRLPQQISGWFKTLILWLLCSKGSVQVFWSQTHTTTTNFTKYSGDVLMNDVHQLVVVQWDTHLKCTGCRYSNKMCVPVYLCVLSLASQLTKGSPTVDYQVFKDERIDFFSCPHHGWFYLSM